MMSSINEGGWSKESNSELNYLNLNIRYTKHDKKDNIKM